MPGDATPVLTPGGEQFVRLPPDLGHQALPCWPPAHYDRASSKWVRADDPYTAILARPGGLCIRRWSPRIILERQSGQQIPVIEQKLAPRRNRHKAAPR